VYVFYSLNVVIYLNWNRIHQYAMSYVCDVDHRKMSENWRSGNDIQEPSYVCFEH